MIARRYRHGFASSFPRVIAGILPPRRRTVPHECNPLSFRTLKIIQRNRSAGNEAACTANHCPAFVKVPISRHAESLWIPLIPKRSKRRAVCRITACKYRVFQHPASSPTSHRCGKLSAGRPQSPRCKWCALLVRKGREFHASRARNGLVLKTSQALRTEAFSESPKRWKFFQNFSTARY